MSMWDTLFSITNLIALAAWFGLVFLPRWPALLSAVLYLGVGLLCLAYAVMFIGLMAGAFDPVVEAGKAMPAVTDYSVDGLMRFFDSRGGLVIGWTHYLAFDLFVGLWIARDADDKGFSRLAQAPVLFATFMVGPLGLLIWLLVREHRARAQTRRR